MITLSVVTFTGSGIMGLLMSIVVIGLICWLLWWLIGYIGLPEPFNKIARVIIAVVAVFFLINCLLGLTGNAMVAIQ